jgi:hypothetical protein
MPALLQCFATQKRLLQQALEIRQLKAQLSILQAQNASMRDGMRRCTTCDYRQDFKHRQHSRSVNITSSN